MKNLIVRSMAGIVFVAVTLGSLLSGKYGYALFFLLVLTGGLVEFYNLTKKSEIHPYKPAGLSIGILLFGISFLVASGEIPARGLSDPFPFSAFLFYC
ncbi:MAG: hypothetical protein AB2L24_06175 [Mangrovibacterium sp.]